MSIVLKDGGIDKSNLVKFRSLSVKNNLYSKSDSCFFTYRKYGSRTYIPAGGNEIGIWDGATKIFGGKIISVKKTIKGSILVYDTECKDWVDTLDKKLVTETYENMTVNAIITDMQATYATAFDITNVACTTVIEKIDFAAMPMSKCLDKLAEITGYHWYVDPDKKIYFFVEGGQSSPFDLTDTNGKYNTQSLEVEDDHAQIKNKVNIQGGSISNVQVSDATSIAAYGEHEVIIRDNDLTSTSEATQKANAVLADYKDPIKKGFFTTNEAGLKPGQEINVNSTIRSISQDFIIQSVSFNARTPEDFEYTVKIMTQRDKELMEFLQNQAMQPLPTPALGNTQFSTNIKFSITNYHEISWAAGTIIMSDGKEYSIAAGNQAFSGTNIIYFKPTTSETVLQFSATLADGMGSDRLAIGYCIENSNVALGAQMIPVGYHGGIRAWGGENIVARTIIADQIGLNSLVSNLVTTGTFITLTAQIGDGIITDIKVLGEISVGHTAAKCTDALADQTSANAQAYSWLTGSKPPVDADNTQDKLDLGASILYAKVSGSTLIYGGYVRSNFMTANNIVAGTMSAVRINGGDINGVTITGVTITGGTVQTSTSGKRVVMSSDVISIYSSSGSAGVIQGFYTGGVNYVNFTGPVQVNGEIVAGSTLRPSATGSKELGNNSFFWNNTYTYRLKYDYELGGYISGIDNSGNSYTRIRFNSTTGNIGFGRTIYPIVSNSYYCGTSSYYWHRVYSDSYWTKNTTFQTFDKYDDLQILRDLKFRNNKLVLKNLPKEIAENGFINFGGMASFNLCASRKIVECVDDLKNEIDLLKLKISKLEGGEANVN